MKRPLEYIAGGFVLGEVLALLPVVWRIGTAAVILAGVCYLRRRKGRSFIWWLLPVFCALGMVRLEADCREAREYEKVQDLVGEEQILLKAKVKGINEEMDRGRLTLELKGVTLEWEGRSIPYGDLLAYVDPPAYEAIDASSVGFGDLHMGMTVSLWGQLEGFQKPGNPGEFDYGAYYHSLGIEGFFFGERIRILDEHDSPYFHGIYMAKRYAGRVLGEVYTEKDGGILSAMILGDKSELSVEIRELYQKNGIAHLLAISGLHVSMMGMGVYGLCRKGGMGFGGAGLIGAAVTVSYGVLAGGRGISASVVRAVVMVLMQMLSGVLGRTYDMRSGAAAAGLLLLMESPTLLFQAGFQMSFGAVLSLGIGVPALLSWLEVRSKAAKAVVSGAVIQLAVCPVAACHFFEYPVYTIFLNLAVIPLMSYVLLSGILAIGAGTWSIGLGKAAAGTGHYVLEFYEWICRKAQSLPGAVLITGKPKPWQLAAYGILWLGFLAAIAVKTGKERKVSGERKPDKGGPDKRQGQGFPRIKRWIFLTCFAAGSLWLLLFQRPVKGMEVTFLDVGQGDGICIRTKDVVILADGGSSDRKKAGQQVLIPFLKSQGISHVDYVMVSHGDQDHISGLLELLEGDCGIKMAHVILPWPARNSGDKAYDRLRKLAEEQGVEVAWMRQGDSLRAGKLWVECIYEGEAGTGERNDHSPLVQVRYGQAGILLTGDISSRGERRWMQEEDQTRTQIQVLKVAHHGSASSTGEEFLARLDPDYGVISCGEGNSYGHPAPETLERLKAQKVTWYTTMETGAVILRTDGKSLTIRTFRKR